MTGSASPSVWSIPVWRNFADALVEGVLHDFGGDRMVLARGMIIAPNNRALRAIRDAFVRAAEPALLLPRLVMVGDDELGDAAGLVFDSADEAPIPPAIDPLERQMLLARLIEEARPFGMDQVDAATALVLATDLGRVLDALTVEHKRVTDLAALDLSATLAGHWQASADLLGVIGARYPQELAARGLIDLTDRRNRLLARAAARWQSAPPPGFVIAAGISTTAPAIAELLRVIARLPQGRVVLSGLDLAMPEGEWDHVRGAGDAPAEQAHPQYHLSLLLDRMGVGRREVQPWPGDSKAPERQKRAALIARAMAPARFTADWHNPKAGRADLPGVSVHHFAGPAEEAQGIALALRGALEVPGQTAALITPDRALAERVSGHLKRWGITADDSAGKPLSRTLAGGLVQAIALAVAEGFAPAALMALLKHPLVRAGEGRRDWIDGVRLLDIALRGPRPAGGLGGISAYLRGGSAREKRLRALASDWWHSHAALLAPLDKPAHSARLNTAEALAALRETALALGGEDVWRGAEGRAVADLIERVEALAPIGPQSMARDALPNFIRTLLDGQTIRPAWGGHNRLFIWGLLEARLQSADLVVLGGLNEGSWPQLPAPDPWLAPRLRHDLGLPGLEFRIGLSAHDFTLALGAQQAIITRAARDATAPTIESRLLLRVSALARFEEARMPLARYAQMLDAPAEVKRAPRPAEAPPVEERPRLIAVTEADTLVQDPYAYYAKALLGLRTLDRLDAKPSPAWRGSLMHGVLEQWATVDRYARGCLIPRIEAELRKPEIDPAIRAFGLPRIAQALLWIETQVHAFKAEGRTPVFAEKLETIDLGEVKLKGKPDRIDRLPDGTLAIVDYKSGDNPRKKQVESGYALQLGLLGVMAECGAFEGAKGDASAFEYWRLSKNKGRFGRIDAMDTAKDDHRSLSEMAHELFEAAVARYLTGSEAFVARLNPDFAKFTDYDHLMRLEEWYGPQG